MRATIVLALSVALAMLAVACNGGEALRTATPEASPSATATPAATATPQATATPTAMERCLASAPDQYEVSVDPAEPSRYTRGVYTVGSDGTGLTFLAAREGIAGLPFGGRTYSLSPSGRSLVFVTGKHPNVTICLASVAGDEPPRALATFQTIWDMALSPDGEQVVVYGRLNDTEGVYVVATKDGAVAPFPTPLDWANELSWSPTGDQLAFTGEAGPDSPRGVYIVNSDGSGLRLLAEGVIAAAAWSPDGSRIAYAPFSEAEAGILLVDVEGNITRVSNTTPHHRTSLAWTPDGQCIAFVEAGNTDEASPIKVVDVESGEEVLVTTGTSPAWSPDGSRIAFLRDGNLYVVNADGSQEAKVTNPSQPFVAEPSWLPDGSRLVFGFVPPFDGSVYVVNPDGSDEMRLAYGWGPVWSPDGERIAFEGGGTGSGLAGRSDIYVMTSDGRKLRKVGEYLWDDIVRETCFRWAKWSWSPDGRFIVYQSATEEGIFMTRADGEEEPVELTPGGAADWSPDGKKIAFADDNPLESRSYPCEIRLLAVNERANVQRLTDGTNPAWSPDGKRIAFDWNGEVHLINVDGTNERKLSGSTSRFEKLSWSSDGNFLLAPAEGDIAVIDVGGGEARHLAWGHDPMWSPDGTKVAFTAPGAEDSTFVYIVDVDGSGEPQLLTEGKSPAWSPDGSRIAFTR